MTVVSKNTGESPESIIEKAAKYFGEGGLGLRLVERGRLCISFEGGGGYVTISYEGRTQDQDAAVDVQTREWDYHAKEFLATL